MQQELKPYCACQCDEQAHKMGLCQHVCVPYPKNKMTELQLLVIDLGDACVVKVEKGRLEDELLNVRDYDYIIDPVGTVRGSFDEVRKAIDGEKPVPRIERQTDNGAYCRLILPTPLTGISLSANEVHALSQLAGHPLPIYEGGTWTDLMPKNGVGWELPINVWRYTR